jgi:hypothetical protein
VTAASPHPVHSASTKLHHIPRRSHVQRATESSTASTQASNIRVTHIHPLSRVHDAPGNLMQRVPEISINAMRIVQSPTSAADVTESSTANMGEISTSAMHTHCSSATTATARSVLPTLATSTHAMRMEMTTLVRRKKTRTRRMLTAMTRAVGTRILLCPLLAIGLCAAISGGARASGFTSATVGSDGGPLIPSRRTHKDARSAKMNATLTGCGSTHFNATRIPSQNRPPPPLMIAQDVRRARMGCASLSAKAECSSQPLPHTIPWNRFARDTLASRISRMRVEQV